MPLLLEIAVDSLTIYGLLMAFLSVVILLSGRAPAEVRKRRPGKRH